VNAIEAQHVGGERAQACKDAGLRHSAHRGHSRGDVAYRFREALCAAKSLLHPGGLLQPTVMAEG
jgi:hypothetical protein